MSMSPRCSQRRDAPDTVPDVLRMSVSFSESTHRLITEEAKRQGMTVSQYIREAAVARLFFDLGTSRGQTAKEIAAFYKHAREAEPAPRRPAGHEEGT